MKKNTLFQPTNFFIFDNIRLIFSYLNFNLFWLAFALLFAVTNLQAQNEESEGLKQLKKSYKQLDLMDYKPLKTNYLLNKGFFFGQNLDVYKAFSDNDREKNIIFNGPSTFLKHLVCLKRSELKEDFLISEETYLNFLDDVNSDRNIVPIGIIQVEGEWLEGYEVDENVEAKKQNQSISKIYQKLNLYSASVLVPQVATPQVNFVLDDFVYFDEKDKIKEIAIDFGDGEGFKEVVNGESISIDYGYPGEKAIAIKMKTKKGDFFNYSAINILAYERIIPDETIELNLTGGINTNSRSGLTGGRADLRIGCDGVLDKPVIFVEGWDALNVRGLPQFLDVNIPLSSLEAPFRDAGYDMIYLNFNDGGADIRTNSTVLQTLIREINDRKIGNEKMMIIGSSMGGIIARHAIRKLELSNYTHNVGHYISYDSPHNGANIPVGVQTLLLDADDIFIRDVFGLKQSEIDQGLQMLNSKAARQMIIRYKGPNPHSDFTQIQNELNSLGFPSQGGIRNVAIVNGANGGGGQAPVNDFNSGDKILSVNWVTGLPLIGLVNAFINVWTNDINTSDKVSSILIFLGVIPTTIKEKSFTFNALNYDICAGGILPASVPNVELPWWGNIINFAEWIGSGSTLNNHGRENICHSPLFSTTASTENITSQNQLNRSVQSIQANGFTPFDAIYSGTVHTTHTNSNNIIPVWEDLLDNELNISPSSGCTVSAGSMGRAPTPYINGDRFYMCEYDNRIRFWNTDPSVIADFFTNNWTVIGPQHYPAWSGEIFSMSYPPPGYYTLQLNRSYNSSINGTISSTYSRVVRSYPYWDPYYGCEETGNIRTSKEKTLANESTLKVFPNPNVGDVLNVVFELSEEEAVELSIQSLDGRQSTRKILIKGKRSKGHYSELFEVSNLPTGIYVILLKTPSKESQQKIIIQK